MKVTNKIEIRLDDKRLLPPIAVMQADAYTRVLEFTLYSGGVAWAVPSDASVAVAYSGSSGRGIYDTLPDGSAACTVEGNVVTAVVAPQAIAMHGKTHLTVVFTDGNGYQIATFCVTLDVAANPAVGAVKPSEYINLRQWMTAELAALLEEMGAIGTVCVKVTQQGIDGIAADKGYTELYAAYVAGQTVYCQLPDGAVLALVVADETGVVFQGEVNREYQKVVITSDDTVTYTSGKYALVGEVAKTYTVLVFPGGDGYTTEDGIDDILAACESSATVVCDVELDGEQACLRLPLVKYNATAAYFGAAFDGKEYLVTISQDDAGNTMTTVEQSEVGSGGSGGVYVGPEEPTDPNVNVWIDPDDDETAIEINPVEATEDMTQPVGVTPDGRLVTAPGGGLGGIQAPATAEVGQTIVVKAVDENGKPTEWECVDISKDAMVLGEITTTEDVSSVIIPLSDDVRNYTSLFLNISLQLSDSAQPRLFLYNTITASGCGEIGHFNTQFSKNAVRRVKMDVLFYASDISVNATMLEEYMWNSTAHIGMTYQKKDSFVKNGADAILVEGSIVAGATFKVEGAPK